MFSTTPRSVAAYREQTHASPTDYLSQRLCSKCGRARPMHCLKRRGKAGPSTRFTPTRWECREGCK